MTEPAAPDPVTLAELDAGLPDEVAAARRRAVAEADPDATAVLDALAATRADLAALETPDVPLEVAARWDAALAAEPAPGPRDRLVETRGRPRGPRDRFVETRCGRAAGGRRRAHPF